SAAFPPRGRVRSVWGRLCRLRSRGAGVSVVWAVAVAMVIGERSNGWRSLAPPAPTRGSSSEPTGRLLRDDSPSRGRGGGARRTRRACSKIGRAHVELQSRGHLVCRLLLEKKKKNKNKIK